MLVAARDEAPRIAATLGALARSLPGAALWVADDGSRDGTAQIARALGARVISTSPHAGKGAAMTRAARAVLAEAPASSAGGGQGAVFLLCDGDLGGSAGELPALVAAVTAGEADVAVGAFTSRAGGGFGIVVAFARAAIRRRCGLELRAPISGQRALSEGALAAALPFADGYGMELAMTIDAARCSLGVLEMDLDLSHHARGRTPAGFLHRGAQLLDLLRAYRSRVGDEPYPRE